MKKTTKPLGKDTRNLTANVGNDLYGDVGRLAAISGCKQGEYVRAVLEYARTLALLVRDNPEDRLAWEAAVAAGASPLPKVRKEVYQVTRQERTPPLEPAHESGAKESVKPRSEKAVCPPPKTFPVQAIPSGAARTIVPSGHSASSLNEDPPKPRPKGSAPRAGQPGQKRS